MFYGGWGFGFEVVVVGMWNEGGLSCLCYLCGIEWSCLGLVRDRFVVGVICWGFEYF